MSANHGTTGSDRALEPGVVARFTSLVDALLFVGLLAVFAGVSLSVFVTLFEWGWGWVR